MPEAEMTVDMRMSTGKDASSPPVNLFRMPAIPGFLTLSAILFAGNWPVLVTLAKDWMEYTASFGAVIVVISAYMASDGLKRLARAGITLRPCLRWGVPVVVLGGGLRLAGSVAGVVVLEQLALLVSLIGCAWLLLGSRCMKILWVPFGYLIFSLPLPGELLMRFSPQLQEAAAWIAGETLRITGMPVVRQGQDLILPHITLQVARECNGINHIIALMSLAIPMMYLSRASRFRMALVCVLSLFLGIALNGLRIAMIGWWSVSHRDLHGPLSTLFVSFIFFAGMTLLYLPLVVFSRGADSGSRVPAPPAAAEGGERRYEREAAFAVALSCIAATTAALWWYQPRPVPLARDLQSLPLVIGGWEGRMVEGTLQGLDTWYHPDMVLERRYVDGDNPGVSLYVGYFLKQRQDHEVASYYTDRYHQNSSVATIAGDLAVNRHQGNEKDDPSIVYFWYELNGRAITGRFHAKMVTGWDWLIRRRTNGAFVAIVPDRLGRGGVLTAGQREFIREAAPLIREYLTAGPALP